jgi:hypothetical protein
MLIVGFSSKLRLTVHVFVLRTTKRWRFPGTNFRMAAEHGSSPTKLLRDGASLASRLEV